jgi:hypothetical protein
VPASMAAITCHSTMLPSRARAPSASIKKSPATGMGHTAFFQREVNEGGQYPVLEQERIAGVADEVPPVHVRPIRWWRRPALSASGHACARCQFAPHWRTGPLQASAPRP